MTDVRASPQPVIVNVRCQPRPLGAVVCSATFRDSGSFVVRASPPVDGVAGQGDGEAAHRHADRAGIDGEAHRRRRDPVGGGQRRQDRLRREEIDDGQEGGEADDERTKRKARGMRVPRHRGRFDRRGKVGHGSALR